MPHRCPACQTDNPPDSKFCQECATPLTDPGGPGPANPTRTLDPPPEAFATGATFAGRYRIIEELGGGGMGRVYKALDTETGEKIALKLIKPEIAADRTTLDRFRNELTTARRIVHKNVGRMFDLGRDKRTFFIAMEYVPGQDLKGLIRQTGQLTVGKAVSIAKQICDGLAEAHGLGIVHRDLKPGNVMIDKSGQARIMDFGIARTGKGDGITGAGVMLGTPEYMAPEQVDGRDADPRSDIYALGVILYEMLTARVPFEGDTALSVAYKHKHAAPEDPRQFNDRIPEELSRVVLRCLSKEKASRFQGAGELKASLESVEQGLPSTERATPARRPLTSREITVRFSLKKLLGPASIAAALIVAAVLVISRPWSPRSGPVASGPDKRLSIAVLPFTDLSAGHDQDYFCDGLATELINRLTGIQNLRVPAQTSSFSFKGRNLSLREIGETLKVESVLAGTLQKSEDRVRVTVELVNVSDGYPIWSQKYERDLKDIFALQDDISLAIVDNLKVAVLDDEQAGLVASHTGNPKAFDLYLKGRYFWARRTLEDLEKAIACYQEAVDTDPDYALAYAALSDSYGLLPFYSGVLPAEAFARAKTAVMKALEIDGSLAEAHSALGFIREYYDWDWEAAEQAFRRAVRGKPGYVTAHHWYAEFLSWMGRPEEAIAEAERALELDPLSPLISYIKAYVLFYARRYDDSLAQCRRTLELDPEYLMAYHGIGKAYVQKEMYEEAVSAFRQGRDLSSYLGYGCGLAGQRGEALSILEALTDEWNRGIGFATPLIRVNMGLGEIETALDWMEKAFERREPRMVEIKAEPMFDPIRSHPRFQALLKKMKLD